MHQAEHDDNRTNTFTAVFVIRQRLNTVNIHYITGVRHQSTANNIIQTVLGIAKILGRMKNSAGSNSFLVHIICTFILPASFPGRRLHVQLSFAEVLAASAVMQCQCAAHIVRCE